MFTKRFDILEDELKELLWKIRHKKEHVFDRNKAEYLIGIIKRDYKKDFGHLLV